MARMKQDAVGKEPRAIPIELPGLRLVAHEWGAQHRGVRPSILLLHATGFHARCWDQVVARLGARHVIALDQRCHGASDAVAFQDWRAMGGDLVGVLERLDLTGAYGVGHSMGGTALLLAAPQVGARLGALLLIDPVVMTPQAYAIGRNPMAAPPGEVNPIARRFDRYESADAMRDRLSARAPHALFDPAVMMDYCLHGLRRDGPDAPWRLACPPVLEASVYETVLSHDPHPILAQVRQPTTVVRAMQPTAPEHAASFVYSPTDPDLAARLPAGRDLLLEQFTHFLPMQDPGFCAGLILGAEPTDSTA